MSEGALTLADVLEGLAGFRLEELGQPITTTVIDSRQAKPGALFVALKGGRADGHDYVADAFSRGAVAAIVERDVEADGLLLNLTDQTRTLPVNWSLPLLLKVSDSLGALQRAATFWRQRREGVRVIGITGSVGKTTTKELATAVLARRYVTLKSEASYNNEIGLPLTLMRLTGEHERVVLEMGMYDVGEIADLARIARPHVGVVTIIGPVHLERAGTIERIVEAKSELVEALPPAPEGAAILNYDDERVRGMAQATRARVFYYGLSPEADLWADHIEGLGLDGIRFRLHHEGETLHVKIPLLGRHSVHTALRAAAAGLVEGLTWQEIIEGLRGPSAQLRLAAAPGPEGATILDDTYNASPASTMAALNLLDELDGRKIAVLGDMLELGDYEREGHEKVGFRVLDVADVLITVGTRGRIIGETALRWGMSADCVHIVEENGEVIDLLERMVTGDDVILVKGSRAMAMEEIVNALSTESRLRN
ncbi:MAG: UDP-N-acetylmuramoylalanyl-D-glutamyl-2, 6-diaminopimelate--D-alanyl-D-alanine ligase [Chloroflexi bacterium]|nr:MAG: UDP-N-acetylmuramoylalanyl-D-glutamyl-2, 6-diaminopimelate--D-alanyl-D-alanine ligase [Chloroflexota bacterium]